VALMLLMVVLGIASLVARRSLATLTDVSTVEQRTSALSDGLRTLTRHLHDTQPEQGDIRTVSDSVIEFVHTIGLATVCDARADSILLATTADETPWSPTLPRSVTADDGLRVWHDESGHWLTLGIRQVSAAAGPCGDSVAPRFGAATVRVVLDDTLPGINAGAPARVVQHERWSTVRGGDGQWSLSLATWNVATSRFSTPQPLVTPLAAPTAPGGPGFSVRAIDGAGNRLADSALHRTRSIITVLRSPAHPRTGALADSVRINVGTR
jgi:hypothetical protein